MNKDRRDKKLTGSSKARIAVFFLLGFSFIVGAASAAGCLFVYAGGYTDRVALIRDMMWENASDDLDMVESYFYDEMSYTEGGIDKEAFGEEWLTEYFQERNSSAELYLDGELVWSCYDGEDTPYDYLRVGMIPSQWLEERDTGQSHGVSSEDELTEYNIYLYVDPEFPFSDSYRNNADLGLMLYDLRMVLPVAVVLSIVVLILSFIFLMCSAGHKNGQEGISPGVLTELPLDLLAFVFGFVAVLGLLFVYSFVNYSVPVFAVILIFTGMLEVVWCTIFCMEFALRLKQGKFWRNTIIWRILRFLTRTVRGLAVILGRLFKNLPFAYHALAIFLPLCFVELAVILYCRSPEIDILLLFWLLEKALMLAGILYLTMVCRKLMLGGEAIAQGDLSYHVDTAGMPPVFQAHGENLNRIGQGIGNAVEERMRSERLKTELITNVSHDLKTPLTSIINYASLIGNENLETGKVKEYAEVLLRQAGRLKKLLEDLVEASKATTGNLEVNLAPCEIGVMLSQAAGEYEQRFGEKRLELIIKQPMEAVRIQADGRHLWRIFDNLLSNVYKYAQENTRVYVNVEIKENHVEIIFRNMSKYALDVSPQELEERFVRGDKSRHMEGNGLGLSIAGSLAQLQGGSMQVVTDGDLFKVILSFPTLG